MEPFSLLAQAEPVGEREPDLLVGWWDVIVGDRMAYDPMVAIPVFLGLLLLIAFLFEKVLVRVLRGITSKTRTTLDDTIAGGLPLVLRPLLVLLAIQVLVQAIEHERARFLATKALTAISIVVVAITLVVVAMRVVDAWVAGKEHLRPLGPPIKLATKVLMVPLVVITVLQTLNVDMTSFITTLGVGALAVGLALQDTLKNLFAGIQLVLDRPIRAGDFIQIDKDVRGTVQEIGLRSTRIRTIENNTIIIPNSTIANAIVTNTDADDRSFTQVLTVGVGYGSDSRRVQAILEDEVGRASKDIPALVVEPPTVYFREFGDSALVFTVGVRLRQYSGRLLPIGEIHHRLHARLRAEGIDIPFPTRTVHLQQEGAAEPPPGT